MHIETITTTEIFMEGDSITITETQVIVEAAVLWTREETAEFTPMFGPMFAPDYDETLVIPPPHVTQFVAPILRDLQGNPTWMC